MQQGSKLALLAIGFPFAIGAAQGRGDTEQREMAALSARIVAQARSGTTPLSIAPVSEYLTDLGRRLAAGIPNSASRWEFNVVKQPGDWTHEPLGLPGGFVFVPSRLFTSAENEAEFAAMLAHAMSHSALGLLRWDGGGKGSLATVPLFVMERDLDLQDDGTTLFPLSWQTARQHREIQADQMALQTLAAVGFDSTALFTYLGRLRPRDSNQSEAALTFSRLARLREAIRSANSGTSQLSSSSFVLVQEKIRNEERLAAKPSRVPSLLLSGR